MTAPLKMFLKKVRDFLIAPLLQKHRQILMNQQLSKEVQILLMLKYKELMHNQAPLPTFDEVEFRVFSQNGEDGILLFIFSLIGVTNKKCVEIGAGNGVECNTANLLINHGWNGLLIDNIEENIKTAQHFYKTCQDTFVWPPTTVQAWATTDNVNTLLKEHGVEGEIDLLSIDIDGVDYWIWKAINVIQPRVVVVEYQNVWGPEKAVTVPYTPDFHLNSPDYCGASLPAFVKLAREKGYRLVGCQRYCFNAFFVRSGIGEDMLPEVSASECFTHPFAQHAMKTRLPHVKDMEWEEV